MRPCGVRWELGRTTEGEGHGLGGEVVGAVRWIWSREGECQDAEGLEGAGCEGAACDGDQLAQLVQAATVGQQPSGSGALGL